MKPILVPKLFGIFIENSAICAAPKASLLLDH